MKQLISTVAVCALSVALAAPQTVWAAPATTPAAKKAAPAAKAAAKTPAKPAVGAAATAAKPAAASTDKVKDGEMEFKIVGQSKDRLNVTKLDPPAAFNLEDIQNFPEDRLQPVLNNPITFEEGRDFSVLMNFRKDQLIHPWLPEIDSAPFLQMKSSVDKSLKDWTFSVIDQGGSTVYKQEGKATPPGFLEWNGEDKVRGALAVDTVYIPQLLTVDKDGYHRTYMGQPVQFASIVYMRAGQSVIELSSKKLFLENKTEFTKEASMLLEKVADALREQGGSNLTIEAYDDDSGLARARQQALAKHFSERLLLSTDQITLVAPEGKEKRGSAMAILLSGKRG